MGGNYYQAAAVWQETFFHAMRSGRGLEKSVDMANKAVDAFNAKFPIQVVHDYD